MPEKPDRVELTPETKTFVRSLLGADIYAYGNAVLQKAQEEEAVKAAEEEKLSQITLLDRLANVEDIGEDP